MGKFKEDLELIIGCATQGNATLKFPFYISPETEAQDIEILGLSVRPLGALKRSHIDTIGQLVDRFDKIRSIRNLGVVSAKESRTALRSSYMSQ